MSDEMKSVEVLDRLRLMVDEARLLPLSNKILLEKGDLAALLQKLDNALPEDVRRAKELLTEQDQILSSSREEAQRTVTEARQEAEKTVSEATEKAKSMLSEAEQTSQAQLNDARSRSSEMMVDATNRANSTLAEAQQRAAAVVADAEERAKQMTDEGTIMQAAREQAQQLIDTTRRDCDAYTRQVREALGKFLDDADSGLAAQLEQFRNFRQQMNT